MDCLFLQQLREVIMDLELYSWNQHERKLKKEGKIKFPSRYKIPIKDNLELRTDLEEILEVLPHKVLCLWALEYAKNFLNFFDEHLKDDARIFDSEAILLKRVQEKAGAFELRQAGFLANQLAKESKSEIGKISARVYAQAIATGHMRSHAIVSSDYAIKLINLLYPGDSHIVLEERKKQILLAKTLDSHNPFKESKKD